MSPLKISLMIVLNWSLNVAEDWSSKNGKIYWRIPGPWHRLSGIEQYRECTMFIGRRRSCSVEGPFGAMCWSEILQGISWLEVHLMVDSTLWK